MAAFALEISKDSGVDQCEEAGRNVEDGKRLREDHERDADRQDFPARSERERDFFIDSLLVRIHFTIEMILVERPCVIEV